MMGGLAKLVEENKTSKQNAKQVDVNLTNVR